MNLREEGEGPIAHREILAAPPAGSTIGGGATPHAATAEAPD